MEPNRHERVMEILGEALELAPGERAAFLDQSCRDDPSLRVDVERLLGLENKAPDALHTEHGAEALAKVMAPPTRVGPYRIVRSLGEGGMGVVYLAMQEAPVRRAVALKLIRPGMDSRQIVARFASERHALALMNHPNVAHVYDAGATETGSPYFVMEYVDGTPINEYCDGQRLSPRQRLELFLSVCDAVQHAHTKGIIHRDLKPSNVLVSVRDGKPLAKVIDFGIAKATQPLGAAAQTLLTEVGLMVGTPEYMSPEQADAGEIDIDTRTDVYALGVMLYELLAGSLPFDRKTLRSAAYDEIRRIIREVDPPRPSTKLSSLGERSTTVASLRGSSDATALRRQLRGDLDWITMKALEKDRERRYGSAAELAADITRHLRYEPVLAGPPTTTYRMGKFVRRHRAAVIAGSLVLAALLAGVIGTSWQAVRATRAERAIRAEQERTLQQKQLAERRFNDVRTLAGTFIYDIDRAIVQQGPTKARELLVKTALQYLDSLSKESAGDIGLTRDLLQGYIKVGRVQYMPGGAHIGDMAGALASFRKGLDLAEQIEKSSPGDRKALSEIANCWMLIGRIQMMSQDPAPAVQSMHEAVQRYAALADSDPSDTDSRRSQAVSMGQYASALQRLGRNDEALSSYEASLKLFEQLLAGKPEDLSTQRDLAVAHMQLAQLLVVMALGERALPHAQQYLEVARKLTAAHPQSPIYRRDVALALLTVSHAQSTARRSAEAIQAASEAVKVYEKMSADDPGSALYKDDMAAACTILGDAQGAAGQTRAAIEAYEKALAIRRAAIVAKPDDAWAVSAAATLENRLAPLYSAVGRSAEALDAAQRHVSFVEKRLKPDTPPDAALSDTLARANHALGVAQLDAGEARQAVATFEKALALARAAVPVDRHNDGRTQSLATILIAVGDAKLEIGEAAAARQVLAEAVELCRVLRAASPTDPRITSLLARALVALALAESKNNQHAAAKAACEEALAVVDAAGNGMEPYDAQSAMFHARGGLAEVIYATDPSAAAPHYRQAIEIGRKLLEIEPEDRRTSKRVMEMNLRLTPNAAAATGPSPTPGQ